MFDYSRARNVDDIIAENHSYDEATTHYKLSHGELCQKIRSGEIQIPYGVSVGRYAAMIRYRIRNRQDNVFLKP